MHRSLQGKILVFLKDKFKFESSDLIGSALTWWALRMCQKNTLWLLFIIHGLLGLSQLGLKSTVGFVDLDFLAVSNLDPKLETLLQEKNKEIMECLQKYIADEYKDKRNEEVDTKSWPIK